MISVALCTFNGERFLAEQLASLREQTHPPGELVIGDDASTDGTLAIARQFATAVPFPVHIESNPTTLGTTRNFEHTIRRCRGDVIALCDQDDIWQPGKLAKVDEAFHRNTNSGFVFSDAALVDEASNPLRRTLWDSLSITTRERKRFRQGLAFPDLLRRNRVTGATLAFRSRFRDLILPIPPAWSHDAWIALLIAAVAPCTALDEPLIQYRQHAAQQIGGTRRTWAEQLRVAGGRSGEDFQAVRDQYEQARLRLHEYGRARPEVLQALAEKVAHAERRARMREPRSWRTPTIIGELLRGRYFRYSRGWAAAAQDFLLA